MTTIDKRTLADLKASREQLKEILKFQQRTELPEVVDGEVFFDAGEGGMDVDGLRQRSLTPEYKLAIRNALYSSGGSQAKFPYVPATLVYFTVKKLGYQLELEGVLRVVPTDLGSIVDFCADMDDHRLAEESKGVSAAFALSDKGDQAAGTSKNALTQQHGDGLRPRDRRALGAGTPLGDGDRARRSGHRAVDSRRRQARGRLRVVR